MQGLAPSRKLADRPRTGARVVSALPASRLLNGGEEASVPAVSTVTLWVSDRTVCRWGAKAQS
jgi:hypothetical protein